MVGCLGHCSSSETRMTTQCRQGSLFSGAGGVWVSGNAGISARENFRKERCNAEVRWAQRL